MGTRHTRSNSIQSTQISLYRSVHLLDLAAVRTGVETLHYAAQEVDRNGLHGPSERSAAKKESKIGEIRQCPFLSHMGLAKVSSAILLNALARIHGEFHTALFKREKAGRNNRVSCPQPLVFLRAAKETKASEQDHWEIVARFCTRRAILSLNRRQRLSR